jgi:hypothetical protein
LVDLCIQGALVLVLNVVLILVIYLIRRVKRLESLIMWKPVETPKLLEMKKKRGRPRKEK